MNDALVQRALRLVLESFGEDPDRDGLTNTPSRFLAMMREMTTGYSTSVNMTSFVNDASYSEMVTVGPVPFYSLCEHHLAPFFGEAWVAYIPNGRIIGISKLARLVEKHARRLQVQERMTHDIATDLDEAMSPEGVGVKVVARHLCMEMRGVRKPGAMTTTTALFGAFSNPATRDEFLRSAQ